MKGGAQQTGPPNANIMEMHCKFASGPLKLYASLPGSALDSIGSGLARGACTERTTSRDHPDDHFSGSACCFAETLSILKVYSLLVYLENLTQFDCSHSIENFGERAIMLPT